MQTAIVKCLLVTVIFYLNLLQHANCTIQNALVPFGGTCALNSTCGKFGTYQGGLGNCDVVYDLCECREFPIACVDNNVCCSGKCENSGCTKSARRNDPCKENTCDTDKGFDCRLIPADNVTLVQTDGTYWGVCELTKPMGHTCDNITFCAREISWLGGWQNCLNGKCDCKFNSPCTNDTECCSGWCHASKCQPSTIGGFCSLKKKHFCFDKYGCTGKYWRLKDMGICENCTTIGSPCNSNTFCCGVGHWPGGYGNCLNNICDCKVDGKCLNDSECCSGDCVDKKCSKGNSFDICTPDTCANSVICNILSNDVSVSSHFQQTRGTCLDLSSNCGKQAIEPHFVSISQSKVVKKIRNGEFAKRHSWPWMLSIRPIQFCGAVLIHRRYALTAAHCLNRLVSVAKYIRYPAYRFNRINVENDITILQLNETVELGTETNIICLAERNFPVGYECVVTGWGHKKDSYKILPLPLAPLRQVKVTLVANSSQCKINGIVCSEGNSGGPSFGDSGGPLMCKNTLTNQWELQGIASGLYYGDAGYASIPYHKEWILRTIQGLEKRRLNALSNRLASIGNRLVEKILNGSIKKKSTNTVNAHPSILNKFSNKNERWLKD